MVHAYDPMVLEEMSLHEIEMAYFRGCKSTLAPGVKDEPIDECASKALIYRRDFDDIWHDKAWEVR